MQCDAEKKAEKRRLNPEASRAKSRAYRADRKDAINAQVRENRRRNPEKYRAYDKARASTESRKAQARASYEKRVRNMSEAARAEKNAKSRARYANLSADQKLAASRRAHEPVRADPIKRMIKSCRALTFAAINRHGFTKGSKTADILGCTWDQLKKHLEMQFLPGMSWANYGKWHVDHILPLARAEGIGDLMSRMKYNNLRPIWGCDNISKGAKPFFLI